MCGTPLTSNGKYSKKHGITMSKENTLQAQDARPISELSASHEPRASRGVESRPSSRPLSRLRHVPPKIASQRPPVEVQSGLVAVRY